MTPRIEAKSCLPYGQSISSERECSIPWLGDKPSPHGPKRGPRARAFGATTLAPASAFSVARRVSRRRWLRKSKLAIAGPSGGASVSLRLASAPKPRTPVAAGESTSTHVSSAPV